MSFVSDDITSALQAPILISLGAIPGALSRYYLTLLWTHWQSSEFPYGTFFINVTGAGLMGFSTVLLQKWERFPHLNLLIAVGFLGAYTTFSTYALDIAYLLRTKGYKIVLLYWIGSPILGLISLKLGIFIATMLTQ